MNARRLLPVGIVVTLLLAAAGLASHGRPLTGSRGSGPTANFFDYMFTTLVLVVAAVVLAALWSLRSSKPATPAPQRQRWHIVGPLLLVVAASLLSYFLAHGHLRLRALHTNQPPRTQTASGGRGAAKPARNARGARLRWDEIAVVAVVVAGLVAFLVVPRRRSAPPPWALSSQEAVSAALDESLDDLRAEPDLRKAIIAAYARMERALAAAGIRRKPSEAPFEYLARALRALDASAGASRRLTDLFEWAKFSQHEPEPGMRDEAIDALVAVRDELRRPAAVAA